MSEAAITYRPPRRQLQSTERMYLCRADVFVAKVNHRSLIYSVNNGNPLFFDPVRYSAAISRFPLQHHDKLRRMVVISLRKFVFLVNLPGRGWRALPDSLPHLAVPQVLAVRVDVQRGELSTSLCGGHAWRRHRACVRTLSHPSRLAHVCLPLPLARCRPRFWVAPTSCSPGSSSTTRKSGSRARRCSAASRTTLFPLPSE